MRYKVMLGSCTYGGKETPTDSTVMSDVTLPMALAFLEAKLGRDEYEGVEIGKVVKTKPDSMGCYSIYLLKEDRSPDTIWAHLSDEEKGAVLRGAVDSLSIRGPFGPSNRDLISKIMTE